MIPVWIEGLDLSFRNSVAKHAGGIVPSLLCWSPALRPPQYPDGKSFVLL